MNRSHGRWLTRYLVLLPASTVAAIVAIGVFLGFRTSMVLFVLSFIGGASVVIGFSGVITATEKFEAAGSTGVLNLDSNLLQSDAEMDYSDRAALAMWGLGVFILCWTALIAVTYTA